MAGAGDAPALRRQLCSSAAVSANARLQARRASTWNKAPSSSGASPAPPRPITGRGEALQGEEAARVLEMLKSDANRADDHYQAMLSQAQPDGAPQQGRARELARMNLPANIHTQWYWKVDLHNLFHFLRLRADPHAQYEIRVNGEAICKVVADWVPITYGAFADCRMGGATLSAKAIAVLQRRLKGEKVGFEQSGMSKGEWREFEGVLG